MSVKIYLCLVHLNSRDTHQFHLYHYRQDFYLKLDKILNCLFWKVATVCFSKSFRLIDLSHKNTDNYIQGFNFSYTPMPFMEGRKGKSRGRLHLKPLPNVLAHGQGLQDSPVCWKLHDWTSKSQKGTLLCCELLSKLKPSELHRNVL